MKDIFKIAYLPLFLLTPMDTGCDSMLSVESVETNWIIPRWENRDRWNSYSCLSSNLGQRWILSFNNETPDEKQNLLFIFSNCNFSEELTHTFTKTCISYQTLRLQSLFNIQSDSNRFSCGHLFHAKMGKNHLPQRSPEPKLFKICLIQFIFE